MTFVIDYLTVIAEALLSDFMRLHLQQTYPVMIKLNRHKLVNFRCQENTFETSCKSKKRWIQQEKRSIMLCTLSTSQKKQAAASHWHPIFHMWTSLRIESGIACKKKKTICAICTSLMTMISIIGICILLCSLCFSIKHPQHVTTRFTLLEGKKSKGDVA